MGGVRAKMTVGNLKNDVLDVDGGTGDSLPPAGAVVVVTRFSSTQFDGWSTANVPTYGGLASYGNFVYATDDKTQYDTSGEQGIVRYDLATGAVERFSSQDGETIDLNVGQDGLLYTLSTPDLWQGSPSALTVTTGTDFNSLFED